MAYSDDIQNYYFALVMECVQNMTFDETPSEEYLADLCCIALNALPAKYIRHRVDLAFYASGTEQQKMVDKVEKAVLHARDFLASNEKRSD